MTPIYFAAAGDIHGDHAALIQRLEQLQERLGSPLAFVLQVGDFEPVRDVLTSNACPDRSGDTSLAHSIAC